MSILTLNAGSSSVKYAVFGEDLTELYRNHYTAKLDAEDGFIKIFEEIAPFLGDGLTAVAHRVVHGGRQFTRPVWLDAAVMEDLRDLADLAPLHQPPALKLIDVAMRRLPLVPHLACFDTAFHASLPEVERRFAIPRAWHEKGIERYGFHGLSYEAIAKQLPHLLPPEKRERVVVAHLGNGASLCAMRPDAQGIYRSLATTMGMTALDGLMMGTRSGSMDPGAVLHLIQHEGFTPEKLEQLLYHQSGLKGVSGESHDMRQLLASGSENAAEAVELYIHSILRHLGSLVMLLGGLDALVFTGGIGENSPVIRERVADKLCWLGAEYVAYDGKAVFSTPASSVLLAALRTDEERVMAESIKM